MNRPSDTGTGPARGLDVTVPLPSSGTVAREAPTRALDGPPDATGPVADSGAPGATIADPGFGRGDATIVADLATPTRITAAGETPAPTRATDPAAPTRLTGSDYRPGTDRIASRGGTGSFTNTGTRRRTRVNGDLPADTQALDLKLQLSRISVFADMASRSGGHLTGKLNRLVEAHGTHGRYVVQRPLAKGGMGAVLEIKDGDFLRRAAMKIILPGFARSPDTLERFLAEAQVTAQLEHPNIVPIHDLGVMDDGTLYFTMKFIEGQSLGGVLKKLKSEDAAVKAAAQAVWTLEHILLTFLKVLDGVGFANSRGVIHRDLKPDNIMLGGHGEVLVVDWGIAKVLGQADLASELVQKVVSVRDQDNLSATMAGNAIGTIYYMPPEQAEGRLDDVDARSDVYALGATLYELVTRKRPLEHESLHQMVMRVAAGKIIPILEAKPDLHPDLAAIVMKAMAFTRDDRYATCEAFADDVRKFLAGQAVAARRRNLIERVGAWVQQHRRQVLVGAGAVALTTTAVTATTIHFDRQAQAEAAQKREEARTVLAAALAPEFRGLDRARELITESLARDAANLDALTLKAEIGTRLGEQERLRGEAEKRNQAEAMLTKAQADFAQARDDQIAAIDSELAAAWKLARLDGIPELRTRIVLRLTAQAERQAREQARTDLLACEALIAKAARLPINDTGLDALIDQAVTTFARVKESPFPPTGLADTGVALDKLRAGIRSQRQAADDRSEAATQMAKAEAALAANRIDEALAAVGAARSRLPGDGAIDALRQRILVAQREAQIRSEREAQQTAARQRAGEALAAARAARKSMEAAAQRSAELAPRIAELQRNGQDRDTLNAFLAERARAQQTVAEQWALVEQSAAAAVTALDTDRDFAAAGEQPWAVARRLLADLYWGRLAAAKESRALPEIAAFTNLLTRFDDGTYRDRLGGAGTLSIAGTGNATLAPLIVQDGRLVPGAVTETLTLPLAARRHASGSFALRAGPIACAIHLPPDGTLAITLPATLPTVPGHDCRVVLPAAGGKGFLLGTYEITQAQYHAYITDAQVWPQVQKAWKAAVRDPETPLTLLPRLARSPDSATWQVHAGTALDQLASVDLPAGLAALPVTGISRTDAEGYCAWLSQRSGHQIRLPRREEWQAAAHGGDPMRIHPWGEVFDRTFPVCAMNVPTHKAEPCRPGSRPADTGPFGHRDLAGNVREWLGDRATPGSDLLLWHGALIAGGGYFDASPDVFRSTYVETLAPETPHGQLGFRILVEIP